MYFLLLMFAVFFVHAHYICWKPGTPAVEFHSVVADHHEIHAYSLMIRDVYLICWSVTVPQLIVTTKIFDRYS
jgi:hypothetical protein